MKILAICSRIPECGKKGDQVLSFHRLSYLALNHKIKLVCFGDAEIDSEAKSHLESFGISVELIPWNKLVAFCNALLAVFKPESPFQCALFESACFQNAFKTLLYEFKPDIVYAVTIRALGNIGLYKGPLFVDLVDSMALNFSRRMDMAYGLKYFLLSIEYERVKKYEKKVTQNANRSFVVSSIDQKIIGGDRVSSLPLGVDGREFFKSNNRQLEPVIIFTGNMNYKPNVDAVLWFYQYCWIKLKHTIPNIRFVVAGANPTSAILALRADNSVNVMGRVPSIAILINSARVSIAPMQSGSGMQFKILEAMACAVPVVSTTLGLGDIGAKVGHDILLADTPDFFVKAIISLLKSEELQKKIGNAGWQYVNEHHTWDALNADFEKSITTLLI
ncbi:RfaG Glycosyltransferase [Candidatus Methylopumilus universalis]|uniref:glycosyltransferase n=1 Tax=Candidatus Methylopumilus universalis TaxID=2588536 RepID=UPI003BEED922